MGRALVLSGEDGGIALAVIRCLGERGVLCHALSDNPGSLARYSRHCRRFTVTPAGVT